MRPAGMAARDSSFPLTRQRYDRGWNHIKLAAPITTCSCSTHVDQVVYLVALIRVEKLSELTRNDESTGQCEALPVAQPVRQPALAPR